MGCCCCKSKRIPIINDAAITALLDETYQETVNPLLHTRPTTTSELTTSDNDSDTVSPLKLLPDIRSLQSLIFKNIHLNEDYYSLYPKYGKFSSIWNATSINEEKLDISYKLLNISLIISLYTNGANNAYLTNLYNILDHSLRINLNMILLPDLIQLIISFISGITFNDNIKDLTKKNQLEFSYENSMVTFKYMTDDYLNIRSNQTIIGPKTIINCYITSKGIIMLSKLSYLYLSIFSRYLFRR